MSTKEPDLAWRVADMEFADANLGSRIRNILRQNGILTLGELMQLSEEEIWDMRNFGVACRQALRDKLAEYGLELKETPPSRW